MRIPGFVGSSSMFTATGNGTGTSTTNGPINANTNTGVTQPLTQTQTQSSPRSTDSEEATIESQVPVSTFLCRNPSREFTGGIMCDECRVIRFKVCICSFVYYGSGVSGSISFLPSLAI
jgi:hypothetical protein